MNNRINFSDRPRRGFFGDLAITIEVIWQRLTDTRRLSEFTMVQEPASVRDLREVFSVAASNKESPADLLDHLREQATRLAVAEVTLTSGIWPFRRSRRVRVVRPSAERYWVFESGDYTPGVQCEELERKWAIQYDLQRQFLLKRNFDTAATSTTSNT